jgi:hypothetical protein
MGEVRSGRRRNQWRRQEQASTGEAVTAAAGCALGPERPCPARAPVAEERERRRLGKKYPTEERNALAFSYRSASSVPVGRLGKKYRRRRNESGGQGRCSVDCLASRFFLM